MKLKVIFFGSSDYCLPVLQSLKDHFDLRAVVTKPDKPVGRKQILTPSHVKEYALNNSIPFFTPKNKAELFLLQSEINKYNPDYFVVADFGMIIPKENIDYSNNRYINIHFSKLPNYRGPSPVQFTILNGDKSAWITYQIMSEKVDEGDILHQQEIPLVGNETTKDLYTKLFNIASIELPNVLDKYAANLIKPIHQDHTKATYTKLFTKEDGYVPWEIIRSAVQGKEVSLSNLDDFQIAKFIASKYPISNIQFSMNFQVSIFIDRMIRALDPWPGVWTTIKIKNQNAKIKDKDGTLELEKKLKILEAHLQPTTILVPDLVQLEGKNPVSWKQFKVAYSGLIQGLEE
jgi:methionyl-tRNA formyltransferase